MLRSEQLEREAEARRVELAETFDELRARARPGYVLNQLVDYATESGGVDFFRNLRDQTVANPLALGLMGAGLAWLIMSNGRAPRRGYGPYEERPGRRRMRGYFADSRERAGHAMGEARHFVSDAAAGVRGRVADAAYDAADLASDAAGSITSTARSARDAASDAAGSITSTARSAGEAAFDAASSLGGQARLRAGDTAAALGNAASAAYGGVAHTAGRTASGVRAFASGTASTGRDMFDFARDQPLVLAGLGLAFGAAIGAAFPSTETERQLMGEASDDLKERTQAFATESYEKSRSAAEAVYDEFQNRVREGSPSRSGHTSIVPHQEEITENPETIRPE